MRRSHDLLDFTGERIGCILDGHIVFDDFVSREVRERISYLARRKGLEVDPTPEELWNEIAGYIIRCN